VSKSTVIGLVKYGLGIGLLVWVVASNWHIPSPDGEELGLAGVWDRPLHWHWYFLGLAVALVSIVLTFIRWYVLVRAQDLPFTLSSALRLGIIGNYMSTVLPGSVGGDIIKAAFIAREQSRRAVAIATVIVDRIVGLCALFWLVTLLGGLFWVSGVLPQIAATPRAATILETIILGAAALSAGSIAFWVFLGFLSGDRAERIAARLERLPKVGPSLAELWRASDMYRNRAGSVGLALCISLVSHLGFVMVFICSSWTVNARVNTPSFLAHFLIVPVGATIQAGFPSPGGVGGGEVAFGELYALLAVTDPAGTAAGNREIKKRFESAGVLASLAKRTIDWIIALIGYIVYLGMKSRLPAVAAKRPVAVTAEPEFSGSASASSRTET